MSSSSGPGYRASRTCVLPLRGLALLSLSWALGPTPVHAQADHFRIVELEQQVRALERQLSDQAKRLAALERARAAAGPGRPRELPDTPAAPADAAWLNSANWQQVRSGMRELDVIERLGPPTSARPDGGDMVLFYALEIGSSAFLGGSVRLQEGRVVDVQRPALR